MREILFRGKRLGNGEWVEGFFVEKKDPLLESDVRNAFILAQGCGEPFVTWFPVDPATVGQFTGLMDRNGNRIFEGDIAKIKGQGVYLCVWSKGNLEFSLTNVKESFGMAYLPMYNATVIGTIHDNPELLEVTPDE